MKRKQHIPALDGLRGAAAALVLVSHLPVVGILEQRPLFSGALGVLVFFELSGFLIGYLYLSKDLSASSSYHYMVARLSRVIPLYWIVVTASYIVSHIIGPSFIYHLTTTEYIRQMLLIGGSHVFWSIPPEIQFYVLFLLIWWLNNTGRMITLLPLVLAVCGMIFILNPVLPGITVFAQLHIFLAGVIVAFIRSNLPEGSINPKMATAVQLAHILGIILVVSELIPVGDWISNEWRSNDAVFSSLPIAILMASFLLSLTVRTRFADGLLGNRWMATLGAYSFSLYLLHEPIMFYSRTYLLEMGSPVLLANGIAIFATIPVCWASYNMIEMPAQKLIRTAANKLILNRPGIVGGPNS